MAPDYPPEEHPKSVKEKELEDDKHNHYFRQWNGKLDIYRVIELFGVTNPAIQHSIKKLLCAGKRGAKDEIKDYEEVIDSIRRAIEMKEEDLEKGENE